jgi:hypothetical protein
MIAKNLPIIAQSAPSFAPRFHGRVQGAVALANAPGGVNIGCRSKGAVEVHRRISATGVYERQAEAIKLICISQNFNVRRARAAHCDWQSLARNLQPKLF